MFGADDNKISGLSTLLQACSMFHLPSYTFYSACINVLIIDITKLKDYAKKLTPYAHQTVDNKAKERRFLDDNNIDALNICEAVEKSLLHR